MIVRLQPKWHHVEEIESSKVHRNSSMYSETISRQQASGWNRRRTISILGGQRPWRGKAGQTSSGSLPTERRPNRHLRLENYVKQSAFRVLSSGDDATPKRCSLNLNQNPLARCSYETTTPTKSNHGFSSFPNVQSLSKRLRGGGSKDYPTIRSNLLTDRGLRRIRHEYPDDTNAYDHNADTCAYRRNGNRLANKSTLETVNECETVDRHSQTHSHHRHHQHNDQSRMSRSYSAKNPRHHYRRSNEFLYQNSNPNMKHNAQYPAMPWPRGYHPTDFPFHYHPAECPPIYITHPCELDSEETGDQHYNKKGCCPCGGCGGAACSEVSHGGKVKNNCNDDRERDDEHNGSCKCKCQTYNGVSPHGGCGGRSCGRIYSCAGSGGGTCCFPRNTKRRSGSECCGGSNAGYGGCC